MARRTGGCEPEANRGCVNDLLSRRIDDQRVNFFSRRTWAQAKHACEFAAKNGLRNFISLAESH